MVSSAWARRCAASGGFLRGLCSERGVALLPGGLLERRDPLGLQGVAGEDRFCALEVVGGALGGAVVCERPQVGGVRGLFRCSGGCLALLGGGGFGLLRERGFEGLVGEPRVLGGGGAGELGGFELGVERGDGFGGGFAVLEAGLVGGGLLLGGAALAAGALR